MISARWLVAVLALGGCAAPGAISGNPGPTGAAPIARLPPPAKIAELIGSNPDRMLATLGTPVLRRRDGAAEVWLYAAGPDCKLDLVYYREGDQLKLTLAHTRGEATAEAACLRRIASLPTN